MEDREVLQQIKGLTISQRERILRVIKEYFSLNSQLESTMPTIYPYCHAHAKFIKRGKLKKVNKQRFSCKECGHKFLTLLEHYLKEEDQILSGTIEFDETYLLESQKGKKTENRKARHRGEPSSLRWNISRASMSSHHNR